MEKQLLYISILLVVVLSLQPFAIYTAYKLGKGEKAEAPKMPKKPKQVPLSKEQTVALREWKNIMNYDGTSNGQEEINV